MRIEQVRLMLHEPEQGSSLACSPRGSGRLRVGSYPFVGARNVSFEGTAWTNDISHGEMIRAGYDQTLEVDTCGFRYLFQGADPAAETGGDYNRIPWHLGLLTESE